MSDKKKISRLEVCYLMKSPEKLYDMILQSSLGNQAGKNDQVMQTQEGSRFTLGILKSIRVL